MIFYPLQWQWWLIDVCVRVRGYALLLRQWSDGKIHIHVSALCVCNCQTLKSFFWTTSSNWSSYSVRLHSGSGGRGLNLPTTTVSDGVVSSSDLIFDRSAIVNPDVGSDEGIRSFVCRCKWVWSKCYNYLKVDRIISWTSTIRDYHPQQLLPKDMKSGLCPHDIHCFSIRWSVEWIRSWTCDRNRHFRESQLCNEAQPQEPTLFKFPKVNVKPNSIWETWTKRAARIFGKKPCKDLFFIVSVRSSN